ncbi:hypothetical protein DAEQUDRAFT_726707 [Daedalea quercina L-15889]|uniref:Hydrophobin n=1 Tax=Daedalea quercina L-15889 TaxID=1314783 RepID=A0A165QFR7_9APHY|nr:hypothetical protein DAEQUDRAFT_726707 [Daedalea quercina L-15889]
MQFKHIPFLLAIVLPFIAVAAASPERVGVRIARNEDQACGGGPNCCNEHLC